MNKKVTEPYLVDALKMCIRDSSGTVPEKRILTEAFLITVQRIQRAAGFVSAACES